MAVAENPEGAEKENDKTRAEKGSRADRLAGSLNKHKALCSVLGIDVRAKLKENDIVMGKQVDDEALERLSSTVDYLTALKARRFKELQRLAEDLIDLWKYSKATVSKNVDVIQLYEILDAKSCDEITGPKLLSFERTTLLEREISKLKSASEAKAEKKYHDKKKKLVEFIKHAHILPSEVGFNPNAPVAATNFHMEAKNMKAMISEVKVMAQTRKELVLRIESIQKAISDSKSLEAIHALIGKAAKASKDITKGPKEPLFDGQKVSVILSNLWSMAVSFSEDLKELNQTDEFRRVRTRSSAKLRDDPQQADTESCSNHNDGSVVNVESENSSEVLDWTKTDKKRMLLLSCNVKDLEGTIKCYKECFGMQVLRQFVENDCTRAFLGFGPMDSNFALELIHEKKDGVPSYELGQRFGHISISNVDMKKLTSAIKSSTCCEMACQPYHLQGCRTEVAFAYDPNGILFELVQSAPRPEYISRVVIYASDIELSISFYQKALGMKVIRKKDEPAYKTVLLRYKEVDSGTIPELRSSAGVKEYDRGNAYAQILIATQDIDKTYEVLELLIEEECMGGKILRCPTENDMMCIVIDPDGWKLALVQEKDYLDKFGDFSKSSEHDEDGTSTTNPVNLV